MVRFSFRKGLAFLTRLNQRWAIDRTLANHKIRLENDEGDHQDLTRDELTEKWRLGQFMVDEESLYAHSDVFFTATPKDLKSLPEADQKDAKERFDLIAAVGKLFEADGKEIVSTREDLDAHIATAAAELKHPKWPSAPTFWRWWQKFRATKCVSKLVDGRSRSGRTSSAEQRSIFEDACLEVFLTPQKKPGKAVWEQVRRKYKLMPEERRESGPSRATVYRWLKHLHHAVVLRSREGKAFAERELRAALGRLEVSSILERYEIDHTPVDVLIICKITRLILGRPWLTLIVDRRSRMIAGLYLSFHAPSTFSVLYSLRMAIMPKDHIVEKYDLRQPWPVKGIPDLIVMDNGMELHADAVQTLTYEMGIEQQFCGVADPAMKGAIERLFRTVSSDLFHQLPGTVFSNPQQRGGYPSEKEAALDLEVFTKILVKWIVEVYHVTPHEGLKGHTPLSVWQGQEGERVIELPAFPEQLDTLIAVTATRTVFHYGIEFGNLFYNSTELQSINHCEEKNEVVDIRAHEHDISYVHVLDPRTDEFFKVPAVDQVYAAGLNRHVHLLVCAETRRRFGEAWRKDQLLDVKAEIQALVDEAVRAKKTGTRKKAAAVGGLDSEEFLAPPGSSRAESPEPGDKPRKPRKSAAEKAATDALDDLPELVATAM